MSEMPKMGGSSEAIETMEQFKKRVETLTGVSFDQIPEGEQADANLHIMAKNGDWYVVAYGSPDRQEEDGTELWDPKPENFRKMNLGK